MDLLNKVLQSLEVIDSSIGTFEFAAPWGFKIESVRRDFVYLFMPVAGGCRLVVRGVEPVLLEVGDVALVVGRDHRFVSGPHAVARPFLPAWRDQRLPDMGPRIERAAPLRFTWPLGLRPEACTDRMITAALLVQDVVQNPVLEALPPIIKLSRQALSACPWPHMLAAFVESEQQQRPGFNALALLMARLVLLALIREHVVQEGAVEASWMRGMGDPAIGHALVLMHDRFGEGWSLASLAKASGLSRTVFAQRFAALVGQSPMVYLTSVRLHAAAHQLRLGASVAKAAEAAGYRSEAAFRIGFVRQFGATPLRYAKSTG
jgi:AraC-like DNA-binding protein